MSEFASFLPTPPADAGAVSSTSVFVTAAATVVPGKAGEPGGFLEASTCARLEPAGRASSQQKDK